MNTVQAVYDGLPPKSLAVAAILVIIGVVIFTRILSGLRGRAGQRRPRSVPYWIPWLGHSFSFARNHIEFLEKTKLV
jgi:hypothetical protein